MSAPPPTGVYVHWPYCARICPYCDFNVRRNRDVDIAAWRKAFLEDISWWADELGARSLASVYFGGGTPSLMPPGLVEDILTNLAKRFDLSAEAEITLEANPTDAEGRAFADFAAAGVGRLSLGVQSFDDRQLAFLGRNHSGQEAGAALDLAQATFGQVTFDLIYALPDEGLAAWADRLSAALARGIGHLSLYQLTIEPGTAFERAVARGDFAPWAEEVLADLYEATQEMMNAAGLPAYEVSNHASPGQEAIHNQLYWSGADWIGIGPGAAGRLTLAGRRLATLGKASPADYLATPAGARFEGEDLGASEWATELIAAGLRPVAGMTMAALPVIAQRPVAAAAAGLLADGLLLDQPDRLVVAPAGRMLIDYIAARLVAGL